MVDAAGDIFGIKAYGVPHLGHRYGNLETIHAWDWAQGHSYAVRKEVPVVIEAPKSAPATPEHVPSPVPSLTRFYLWDMDGKPMDRFNRDQAVRGFVQSIFALSAQDAATLAGASIIQACPNWVVCKDAAGEEFQMTWRR
jgi:hypothetical protein